MRLGGAVNNGLVVTEHVALLSSGYTKIMEGQLQIHLINTSVSCHELTSIGCSLNGGLLLGIPVGGHLVEEVKNASDGMACKHIMIQVGIDIVGEDHIVA